MANKISQKQVDGLVNDLKSNKITSIAFGGTATKTFTITFSDGTTKTATFTDIDTVYNALTLAELATGTDSVNKLISAKVLADYINTRLSAVMSYKGQKNTWAELPVTGNKTGDMWNVATASDANGLKAGDNVAWDGTKWDVLSGTIDTSKFLTAETDPTGVKALAVSGTTTKTITITLNNNTTKTANFDVTAYGKGTLTSLLMGTDTAGVLWDAKTLSDFADKKAGLFKTDTYTTVSNHLTGSTTAVYTLTAAPLGIDMVTMNGVVQPANSYTVSGGTSLVITQSLLPVSIEAGDEIAVRYKYTV